MVGTHTVTFPIMSDTHLGQSDYLDTGEIFPPPFSLIIEVQSPCYFDNWKLNVVPHHYFFVYAVD